MSVSSLNSQLCVLFKEMPIYLINLINGNSLCVTIFELKSPILQVDTLPFEPPGKLIILYDFKDKLESIFYPHSLVVGHLVLCK